MNATQYKMSNRHETIYLIFAIAPLVGLFGILAVATAQQRALASSLQHRIDSGEVPLGNDSLSEQFARDTSDANTAAWSDVLLAALAIERSRAPDIDVDDSSGKPLDMPQDPLLKLTKQVTEAEVQRMKRAAPVIAAIDRLSQDSSPVWQNTVFNSFDTSLEVLQDSRVLSRLLTDECRVAIATDDQDRAFDAMRMMPAVADAMQQDFCIVTDLVSSALHGQHRTVIQESLEIGFWDDVQALHRIADQLADDRDHQQRWQKNLRGELAMLMQVLHASPDDLLGTSVVHPLSAFPFGIAPAMQWEFLDGYDRVIALQGAGTRQHVKRVSQEETQFVSSDVRLANWAAFPFATSQPIKAMVLPAVQGYATAIARGEQERIWTLTALAIKAYQIREGRWPLSLAELESDASDPIANIDLEANPMGYQVAADSVVAYLWINSRSGSQLSATPPMHNPNDPRQQEDLTIAIR